MSDINMASLASKLRNLELFLKSQHGRQVGYGRALREAILATDPYMEVEVLKSLGDLHLQKGKFLKHSAEFDKAAALYDAALLRCPDPDMGQTLDHRIGYMEKLSRQLLQGYTPQYEWMASQYCSNADSNASRVAEICDKLDRSAGTSWRSVEEIYTETLVTAIGTCDVFLEIEALKSLGDFYLEKGKAKSDLSQFSKVAAMYRKALARCKVPYTEQALLHRILYMEKIREGVRKQSLNKTRRRQRKAPEEHQLENMAGSGDIQDQRLSKYIPSNATDIGMTSIAAGTVEEETLTDSQYKDHLKEGESSLARSDLNSAEKHFAAALRTVHIRGPTSQQYQREVEPLCKLGDVYRKRGQQTGDGGDFVKAAALYNAAIVRSDDNVLNGTIESTINKTEKAFLNIALNIQCNVSQDDTRKHKTLLEESRDKIKLEMDTIDQQLDPYVVDEEDPHIKEIEAKRAQAVRQLFEKIAEQREELINLLLEECIALMGLPPCKYALIGLGSQATGLVTPYSDLEFAILVEEESEDCLMYFRNLTHYLHLKVVNLGETVLPTMGIKSINDFYSDNPLDDWYYDSVTPRGFAFDGSMPKASKTPLGRRESRSETPRELICTPENMVSILQKDVNLYLHKEYHLATILRNPCLIAGDKDLIWTYMDITVKILQADGGTMARQLADEILGENIKSHGDEKTITARLIDVKKELYRFPSIAVDCLALFSCIIPTTVWNTIEEMENQRVISPNNAHHLRVLASISAELRLRTYIANGGQRESLSALASMETALQGQESSSKSNQQSQANPLNPVFHLPSEQQLFRYYYTAVPLKLALSQWPGKEPTLHTFADFYDSSPSVQGLMCQVLCKYSQAITCYNEALRTEADRNTTEKTVQLLHNIGCCCSCLGDYQKAISFTEQALHKCRTYQMANHPHIATLLHTLGNTWISLGDENKAINYFEHALQLYRSIHGQNAAHPGIANLFNSMGSAWQKLSDHRKATSYHEQALQMYWSLYGHTSAHPDIASTFNSMGKGRGYEGDFKESIRYLEVALQVNRSIFGQNTAHPDIAVSLNDLGQAWCELNDQRKAINYLEQSLQMYMVIYGHSAEHPAIASALGCLGSAWRKTGNRQKAITYHEQALQMHRSMHGQSTAHPDTARSLNRLGGAWHHLGDYRKATIYLEQAVQMFRSIHGQSTAHLDTVMSIDNLGSAWCYQGNHRKAASYLEQALQMYRSIYGQTTARPEIITTLQNLGVAWCRKGDPRKAINYYEQALQMCKSITGQSVAHSDIIVILISLGTAWSNLGNDRKAVDYYNQALQMARRIHSPSTEHLDIAMSLLCLAAAWQNLGDDRKETSFKQEALDMITRIGLQDKSHPFIKHFEAKFGEISL